MTASGRLGSSAGRPARCVVWLAEIVSMSVAPELLDTEERARRSSLPIGEERVRFTAGAALISSVTGAYTGTAPQDLRVDRSCPDCRVRHGKPEVPGTGLHLSLSHSGRLVALAVTRQAPVGVDIEAITRRNIDGLWRMILAPGERRSTAAGFYTCWCRKESVVKATGDGLRTPLTSVAVSGATGPAVLRRYRDQTPAAAMSDFIPAVGYAGAVTVLTDGPLELDVRWWPLDGRDRTVCGD
jgi:4'-phosphopantetheinyl transferase